MIAGGRFVLGTRSRRVAWLMVTAGAIAAVTGVATDPWHTWPHLLVNGYYLVALALGGPVFLSLHYLSRASWSANIRRVPEAMTSALPLAGLLMMSVFFGRGQLYLAGHAGRQAASSSTALYLAAPFLFGRMALFLVIWAACARAMRRTSLRQDDDPAPIHHQRLVRGAAMFIVVFALTFSLASFDWLMSLARDWSSTIFAVYWFAGLLSGGLAAITLGVVLLLERGDFAGVVAENQLHDLGKLLFAFSTFWAYVWFSQYLLIWYGNLPEETAYYIKRTNQAWIVPFVANLLLNWAVPFLVLMPRAAKRSGVVLKWMAIAILAGRWLDVYLAVMPEMMPAPSVRWPALLVAAGYAAAFFLLATRSLAGAPLVPVHDLSSAEPRPAIDEEMPSCV